MNQKYFRLRHLLPAVFLSVFCALSVFAQADYLDDPFSEQPYQAETTYQTDFSAMPVEGLLPLEVSFQDESEGTPNRWQWDFQNDGNVDSSQQSPTFTYNEPGLYDVSGFAFDYENESAYMPKVKSDYIRVYAPVDADFSMSETNGIAPLTVSFSDQSTGEPVSWSWQIGNGAYSQQNPTHTFLQPGVYSVALSASHSYSSDSKVLTDCITVYAPVHADFQPSVTEGFAPLSVSFQNMSTGDYRQSSWDFNGDGIQDSNMKNPQYTYLVPGTYSVFLKVFGPGGQDVKLKTQLITVKEKVTADFSADKRSGAKPLTVTFTDTSIGDIVSRSWDFDGDGNFDMTDAPAQVEYTYSETGVYTVGLFVTGNDDSDEMVKNSFITVLPEDAPEYDSKVIFSRFPSSIELGKSVNASITMKNTGTQPWLVSDKIRLGSIGDSDPLTSVNRISLSQDVMPGESAVFELTLSSEQPGVVVSDWQMLKEGAFWFGQSFVRTVNVYERMYADFAADVRFGNAPLSVQFTDHSYGLVDTWEWDFDNDGTVDSTEQNPTYVYTLGGRYHVKLTVSNDRISDAKIKYFYIFVNDVPQTPQGLKAIGGPTSIKVQWYPNQEPDIAGYALYRAESANGEYVPYPSDELIRSTWFIDRNVTANVTYYYKIQAIDWGGLSSEISEPADAMAGSLQIFSPDFRGQAGQKATMSVNTRNAFGIGNNHMEIWVTYDPQVLTPDQVQKTWLTRHYSFASDTSSEAGVWKITGDSNALFSMLGEGNLLNLSFDVSSELGTGVVSQLDFTRLVFQDILGTQIFAYSNDRPVFILSSSYMLGDVNGDGSITLEDPAMILSYLIGETEIQPQSSQWYAADMNGDNQITVADAVILLRIIYGLGLVPSASPDSMAVTRGDSIFQVICQDELVPHLNQVYVPVSISHDGSIAAAYLEFVYDQDLLEFSTVASEGSFDQFQFSEENGVVKVALSNYNNTVPASETLFFLVFKATGQVGDETSVAVSDMKLSGLYGDDAAWEHALSSDPASITIQEATAAAGWCLFR